MTWTTPSVEIANTLSPPPRPLAIWGPVAPRPRPWPPPKPPPPGAAGAAPGAAAPPGAPAGAEPGVATGPPPAPPPRLPRPPAPATSAVALVSTGSPDEHAGTRLAEVASFWS